MSGSRALDPAALPNVNALWAALLVEELVRQGVGLFVVCPGSRSTPLAVAVARAAAAGRCEWLVHPDERAAAFVALGWGRARGAPAAVVTTSGSAVAHLFPAVVEADAAGVPLLLLTADRPPELRETGANQTIRQPGLFGGYVRWSFDMPPPTADVDPAFVLTTAAHAVARSLAPAGPVHLNLAFREPLGLEPDGTDAAALLAPLETWAGGTTPYARSHVAVGASLSGGMDVRREIHALTATERGVVVLGPGAGDGADEAADDVAYALGWPLLADVTSGGRDPYGDTNVPNYDALLASERFAALHRPEAILQLGARPTSKRLTAFLEGVRPRVVVHPGPERLDPSHIGTIRLRATASEVRQIFDDVGGRFLAGRGITPWAKAWQSASAVAGLALEHAVAGTLSEPNVARIVGYQTARALVLAASMPVRDADLMMDGPLPVFANRGASGIDGTIATAHGVARALGGRTLALVGDLALVHDQTSLMLLRSGPPVVVVVVNNDGGGIFHFLPVARGAHPLGRETFEAALAAPHGLTFAHAAAQVGLPYHAPETADAFEAALDAALGSGRSALIEVRTDRRENERLHARILDAVRAAVDAAL